jgi:opacity protein-like surface antigen
VSDLIGALARCAVLLSVVPAMGWAQDLYITAGAGPGRTPATNDGRAGDEDASAHKTGFTGGASLGYALQPALRAEAELGFIRAPVKSDGDVPLGGVVKSYLLTANLRYEPRLPIPQPFKAYVGAGLGGARVLHEDEFIDFFGAKRTAHQWRSAFAYQARAGIAYEATPSLDVSMGYRYVHVNRGSVDQQHGSSLVRVNFDAISNHSLEVAVAMRF